MNYEIIFEVQRFLARMDWESWNEPRLPLLCPRPRLANGRFPVALLRSRTNDQLFGSCHFQETQPDVVKIACLSPAPE